MLAEREEPAARRRTGAARRRGPRRGRYPRHRGAATDAQAIAELSDDEVEAMLLQKLAEIAVT